MPLPIVTKVGIEGIDTIPYAWTALKVLPWLAVIYALKRFFGGARNYSERNMHGKVVMITGGTSGIGAETARALASRGAQLVLLIQHPLSDPFLVDFIEDLRESTGNELITAEQVDLSSLHSIRLFATKWVDNAPPRRLDMIILCANTLTPPGVAIVRTADELESNWGINYFANFHLLSILSPALRAQPPDREVRIIFGTCSAYMAGSLKDTEDASKDQKPKEDMKIKWSQNSKEVPLTKDSETHSTPYADSKLALMTFASAFQKHLSTYVRPDKQPMNARVIIVDPGWTRTPGMRRFLTFGSLWGLMFYLITWPFWWLVLKSPEQGAQTFLYAAMEAQYGRGGGGWLLKECQKVKINKEEVVDEEAQKKLWEWSDKTVERVEKIAAIKRVKEKKEKEMQKAVDKKSQKTADAQQANTGASSAVEENKGAKKTGSRKSKKSS